MDTFEQYIKMCDCGEIQGKWELKELDQYVVSSNRYVSGYSGIEYIGGYFRQFRHECWMKLILDRSRIGNDDARLIWLPRQDQLQGMVKSDPYFSWNYVGMLGRFVDKNVTYSCLFESMEQLWLAFVMHELHKKKWDGKTWEMEKNADNK